MFGLGSRSKCLPLAAGLKMFKGEVSPLSVSSFALATSLGIGVLLAAAFVLVFEGGLVLLAQYIAPFMTDYVINEITCAGSLIIIAIGLNLIGLTNIKCANFLPAIFLPVILCLFM